ncbi:endonuclease/exonuclease/phosphatase family protein [Mangrovicoccus sp. HB161399]|uniref:endonuclease/exonuclease/phosphatase family protein n=1 Tax=Mangrovicoccus sp. HB161399 TaxID=2720392 RepID=UPI0015537375|nr:endonuclease/exonuclease/phosphatase family protein [Mangrovicoccus sp. HB161399]
MSKSPPPYQCLVCALLPPSLAVLAAAATAREWPADLPLAGALGRMLESLQPQLAALAVLMGLALALLGARRLGAALAIVAVLAGGAVAARHLRVAQPLVPGAAPVATVLWINLLNTNATPPEELAEALAASPADVILVAEPRALQSQLAALSEAFPVQVGCRDSREGCGMLALARDPAVRLRLRKAGGYRPGGIAVAEIDRPGAAPLTVIGAHLVKPWFDGMIEPEAWYLVDALRNVPGPLVLAGDFNAAPWSQRGGRLERKCGMLPPRLPVATWPVAAGALGVPIDGMMVRGGARLASLAPWGEALGSNHRGLLASVAVPGPETVAPPDSCSPAGYFD